MKNYIYPLLNILLIQLLVEKSFYSSKNDWGFTKLGVWISRDSTTGQSLHNFQIILWTANGKVPWFTVTTPNLSAGCRKTNFGFKHKPGFGSKGVVKLCNKRHFTGAESRTWFRPDPLLILLYGAGCSCFFVPKSSLRSSWNYDIQTGVPRDAVGYGRCGGSNNI